MYIPKSIKDNPRYQSFVSEMGQEFTEDVALPFVFGLVKALAYGEHNFFPKHSARYEKFVYLPSKSEALSKVLELRDKGFLDEVRDVLTRANVTIFIDGIKTDVNFNQRVVLIEHPYLIRMTDRSKVIFHVSRHSIRLEIK